MKKITLSLLLAVGLISSNLCAQSESLPSNEEIEKSLEKVEDGMDFMLQFFDSFGKEFLEGLHIEGLEDMEIKESDKDAIRESMKQGFTVLKDIDIEKLEGLLKEMESQFKDLDFGEFENTKEKKKEKTTKI